LRQQFEGGDRSALLKAIYHCCLMKRSLPDWLRLAFLDVYESATGRYEIKSWDHAFDQPHPKGAHLDKEKLRRRIIERVWALKAEDPEKPIDRGLFEQIGKELDISGSTIDGLYYDERSRYLRESYETIYRLFTNPEKK
jgi:hypothetical protein